MEKPYAHSIRNKLYLAVNGDELAFAVCSENQEILSTGTFAITDDAMLRDVLDTKSPFQDIFSAVVLVFDNCPFVLHPSDFSNAADRKLLFETSYPSQRSGILKDALLSNRIGITYSISSQMLHTFRNKFSNLNYHPSAELFSNYAKHHKTKLSFSMHLWVEENHLHIQVSKGEELLLLNRYDSKTIEDSFYFVMLAIEQLEVDIEQAELVYYGNDDIISFNEIERLFSSYIANVTDRSSKHPVINMAMLCA